MKKTKAMYSMNSKMVAVFVAGLAVATLGWYWADRLNVAFGRSADINVIGTGKGEGSDHRAECVPGTKTHEIRELVGCDFVTKTVSCTPVQTHVTKIKTMSGNAVVETKEPRHGSQPVTKFENKVEEVRTPIAKALSDVNKAVEESKRGKSASTLAKDEHHQELVAKLADVRALHQKAVGLSCPPGILKK